MPRVSASVRLILMFGSTLACLAWGWGCGPSVQSIYEGNVRFEHCYRLDLDLEIAASHREVCWKQWLKSYTYGQPRDRMEYARRRVRAFGLGDASRPTLSLSADNQASPRQFYMVPAPTSIHAPPPAVATVLYADAGALGSDGDADAGAAGAAGDAAAPEAGCSKACNASWLSCQDACGPDGGPSNTCRSCKPDYKSCMRRCFE